MSNLFIEFIEYQKIVLLIFVFGYFFIRGAFLLELHLIGDGDYKFSRKFWSVKWMICIFILIEYVYIYEFIKER